MAQFVLVMLKDSPLPYRDNKPQGAADFYFAINATFRFVRKELGQAGLIRYWRALGRSYLKPVHERWKAGGMDAIGKYWDAFFAAEPECDVQIERRAGEVVLDIRTCPAIAHLRQAGREIVPEFCQHCYYVSEAAAREAGYTVRVCGGAGSCTQIFYPRQHAPSPQDLGAIHLNEPPADSIQNP